MYLATNMIRVVVLLESWPSRKTVAICELKETILKYQSVNKCIIMGGGGGGSTAFTYASPT